MEGNSLLDQAYVYTIKELTNYLKEIIENDSTLSNIWIRGEISNFTHHSSGHMYFTLKDDASKLRAIMFLGNNRTLKFIPKNGMKVIAKGFISIYERDGNYQFYAQEMQPDGIGQLYLAYEQLRQKLDEEGLFDQSTKKELPSYPLTIGVITSPTGAAVRDIITTIRRRYPVANILIYPVQVQGEFAAKTIAVAIKSINNYNQLHGKVDVLIVGRGGGSIEELWAFNEEIVARTIYESKIPVISAVGHETDFTIADFVSDIRAATPTAAAELAVPHIDELKTNIAFLEKRLERQIKKELSETKSRLNQVLKSVVFKRPKQGLYENIQRLDRLEDRLKNSLNKQALLQKNNMRILYHRFLQSNPQQNVKVNKARLELLNKQLIRELLRIKEVKQNRLNNGMGKLDALSPLKVMLRGYAIPYHENGNKLIKSIKDVQLGDILTLHLTDGRLDCQVWGLKEKTKDE